MKFIALTAGLGCLIFIAAMMIWNIRELFKPMSAGVARRFSGWIPIWKLFAPGEYMTDYCFLARPTATNDWSCIFLPETRRWFHIFWNPKIELNKYLSNCAAAIQYSDDDTSSSKLLFARQALHEFACVELQSEDAELQSAINLGTVTQGVYHSSFAHCFTLTSKDP